eukprot:TRINITY_DN963_c0_g1_i3.p1 TRINITY_DN963_c0_g1~~TRINITY_DN963_c0_g1_i3.p1  ORF type:complete len:370 (-),score=70.54 TRINITY_DN963_c0_g1_i3:1226-2335(-)
MQQRIRTQQAQLMSAEQEASALTKLQAAPALSFSAARFRRRLALRQHQRRTGAPIFDLDAYVTAQLLSMTQNEQCLGLYYPNTPLHFYYPAGPAVLTSSVLTPAAAATTAMLPPSANGAPAAAVAAMAAANPGPRPPAEPVVFKTENVVMAEPTEAVSFHKPEASLRERLGIEGTIPKEITSPWSGKVLKTFIARDISKRPVKMRFLEDVVTAAIQRNDPTYEPPERTAIDYMPLLPHHVWQCNDLLREEFWPGVDVTEFLQYPEFTVVALYRRKVIGCGFVTPTGYLAYIAMHPEWRKNGLGTFMLYHLITAVPDKDITLHVSPANHAMILYQKFGFKPEEYVIDYYNKYYATDDPGTRNAYLMRLRR